MVPGNNEMRLPDDTNPSLRWDDNLKRWVGEGMEEDEVDAPPPTMTSMASHAHDPNAAPPPQRASLKDVRATGGLFKNTLTVS